MAIQIDVKPRTEVTHWFVRCRLVTVSAVAPALLKTEEEAAYFNYTIGIKHNWRDSFRYFASGAATLLICGRTPLTSSSLGDYAVITRKISRLDKACKRKIGPILTREIMKWTRIIYARITNNYQTSYRDRSEHGFLKYEGQLVTTHRSCNMFSAITVSSICIHIYIYIYIPYNGTCWKKYAN